MLHQAQPHAANMHVREQKILRAASDFFAVNSVPHCRHTTTARPGESRHASEQNFALCCLVAATMNAVPQVAHDSVTGVRPEGRAGAVTRLWSALATTQLR